MTLEKSVRATLYRITFAALFFFQSVNAEERRIKQAMYEVAKRAGVTFVNPSPALERKLIGSWQADYCISAVSLIAKKSGTVPRPCDSNSSKVPVYDFFPKRKCKSNMGSSNCRYEIKDGYIQIYEVELSTKKEGPTAAVFVDGKKNFYMGSHEEGFIKLLKK